MRDAKVCLGCSEAHTEREGEGQGSKSGEKSLKTSLVYNDPRAPRLLGDQFLFLSLFYTGVVALVGRKE